MKKTWWKEGVLYQIYPRSFLDTNNDGIGDLKGIIKKLDYIKDLGATIIWICPFYESSNYDNGYDVIDYRKISPEFGTMKDVEMLLKKAHEKGLKIVIDMVVNHTSCENKWFIESKKNKNNKYRDYYIWKKGKKNGTLPPNNWTAVFGGSVWEKDEKTNEYYLHLFCKEQPDLNWENKNVRQDIFDIMNWWIDKGVDGFRMDAIGFISKNQKFPDGKDGATSFENFFPYVANGPRLCEFIKEMNENVLSRKDVMTVAEMSGTSPEKSIKYANDTKTVFDMLIAFEHIELDGGDTFKWTNRKIDIVEMKKIFSKWQSKLYNKSWNSLYWNNHDQPRVLSRLGKETGPLRERSAKMIATSIHMLCGTPYVYQGEELGMTNASFKSIDELNDVQSINAFYEHTQNGRYSEKEMLKIISSRGRDGARTPMQWNDSNFGGFSSVTPWIKINPNYKTINAEEEIKREDSVFNYYKKLIALRKKYEVIVYGKYELLDENNKTVWTYTRTLGKEKILIICNFASKSVDYNVIDEFSLPTSKVLISNVKRTKLFTNGILAPYEAMVIKK